MLKVPGSIAAPPLPQRFGCGNRRAATFLVLMAASMQRPTLSLIIPVYNEEEVIPELDKRLRTFFASMTDVLADSWEVIFVNDGSRDGSMAQLRKMAGDEPRYRIVSFARNFGHQMAITAGLDRARGEAVVV